MSLLTLPSDLICVDWLANNINHKQLVLLDASWFMPALKRDGKAEWKEKTIKNARYFDFDKSISDKNSELPHMMPSEADFQQAVSRLGINQNSVLVVFDRLGIFSSPRVWWMFKSMGFNNVAVLDGGLNSWLGAGFVTSAGEVYCGKEGDFIAQYQPMAFCDKQDVLKALEDENKQILDARPQARFLAEVAEPRADLRSGHMPTAKNLPFAELLKDGEMQSVSQLQLLYANIVNKDKQLLLSCGSGVTACVLALGATLCGYENIRVYDGSWTEWGADEKLPVVK